MESRGGYRGYYRSLIYLITNEATQEVSNFNKFADSPLELEGIEPSYKVRAGQARGTFSDIASLDDVLLLQHDIGWSGSKTNNETCLKGHTVITSALQDLGPVV